MNLFPEDARELYKYFLAEAKKEKLSVEICASDDDFKIIELHCEIINIAKILCTSIVLPFVINMITSFLHDKITKNNRADIDANIELHVEKNGKSKKLFIKVAHRHSKNYLLNQL